MEEQFPPSVSPLTSVAAGQPPKPSVPQYQEFTESLLTMFYNYAMSFECNGFIPVQTLQGWYEAFKHKLSKDPLFWQRHSS